MTAANSGSGSGAPLKLFTEPATTASPVCATGGATVQTTVGSLAVDPWRNLFFTDSALDTCDSSDGFADQSDASSVKELAFVGGSYAAAPVTLYTLTPSNPAPFGDEVDALAIDSTGRVYFATQYGGVVGFVNDGTPFTGKIVGGDIYGVSTTGAKALAVSGQGDLYVVGSKQAVSGGYLDTLGRVSVNRIALPASPMGVTTALQTPQAVTSVVNAVNSAEVMVNDGDCSTARVSLAYSEEGSAATEFKGTVGACADLSFFPGQSVFPVELSFTPAGVGARSAVATATNIATGSSQAATAFGVGQGGIVTLDPGVATGSYTNFSNPVGIAADDAGDIFVTDASGTVTRIPAGAEAGSVIATGFSRPSGVALDANGNLYVADTWANQILEIPSATGTPGAVATAVSSSVKFGGSGLDLPNGLAMGADGVLYIADTGNKRVVIYDPATGVTAVRATGFKNPGGIAVGADGSLYVADAGDGSGGWIDAYPGGGGAVTMLKPNGVTEPVGVAVDASRSLVVSDGPTGAIVRVPNVGGTLNAADAAVIASNRASGSGVALDGQGNLYTTDPISGAVYAERRTASAIDFGKVEAGATGKKTVMAENAGNLPLALAAGASSFLTQPATKNFAILAGPQNDCLAATSLDAGAACEFVAEFAPAAGTAAGELSDAASFDSSAVDAAAPIALKGTVPGSGGGTGTGGFSIALGETSLTVKAGGSATTMVSITPQNGFSGNITFSCSGLPPGTACSFSPASVMASGQGETTQLTITASADSAALRGGSGPLFSGGAALAGLLFCCFGFRKRRGLWMALRVFATVAGAGLISGCGVQFNPGTGTTASMVTVNASSGSLQSSATLTLTVQR
jgi:sugar lactone lactonase YvrE